MPCIDTSSYDLNFNFVKATYDLACSSSLRLGYRNNRSIIINSIVPDPRHRFSTNVRFLTQTRPIDECCNRDLNFIRNSRCHPSRVSRQQVLFIHTSMFPVGAVRGSRLCRLNFNYIRARSSCVILTLLALYGNRRVVLNPRINFLS